MTLIHPHTLDLIRQSLKEACPELAVKEVWDARVDELVELVEKALHNGGLNA